MKLIECKDWKAVHLQDRTILRSDRNLYPRIRLVGADSYGGSGTDG